MSRWDAFTPAELGVMADALERSIVAKESATRLLCEIMSYCGVKVPSTLIEALEEGRADYMRVTGQSE